MATKRLNNHGGRNLPVATRVPRRERLRLLQDTARAEVRQAMQEQLNDLTKQFNKLVIDFSALKRFVIRNLHRHPEGRVKLIGGAAAPVDIDPQELLDCYEEVFAECMAREKAEIAKEEAAAAGRVEETTGPMAGPERSGIVVMTEEELARQAE